jgi:hypothetical protein
MSTTTDTKTLIDSALAARANLDAAIADSARANLAKQAAEQALQVADQALHDDLTANGPALTVDTSVTPPVAVVYTAVEPDTWKSEEIRIAA